MDAASPRMKVHSMTICCWKLIRSRGFVRQSSVVGPRHGQLSAAAGGCSC